MAAVHAAMLILLRGDLPTGMHAAHELLGPILTFKGHEHEYRQHGPKKRNSYIESNVVHRV